MLENMRIKSPFVISVFGASGVLAKLKIFPALYKLMEQDYLPEEFYIIGFARTKKTGEQFKKEFRQSIYTYIPHANAVITKELLKRVYYFAGQYNKADDYKKFRHYVAKISQKQVCPHLVYFSVPPIVFNDIIKNLGETLSSRDEDMRLIIEKPFGQDEDSAKFLFHFAARYFRERNIYLLDHYLGKTSVKNILKLRHYNRMLNLLLKGNEVANIQITALETVGVDDRVGYFDQVGTLKDMMQSHLLQILSMITMSIPISESSRSIHREKYAILSAITFPEYAKNIILGQYDGYKYLKGVDKNSNTETFVAARFFIDRESWYKVPIYIRTGKKLVKKHSYIVIELKRNEYQQKDQPSRVVIELQPRERISITLANKIGNEMKYFTLTTEESMQCLDEQCLPEHSVLLLEAIQGNKMNFLSFPEILATWRITDSIHQLIKAKKLPIEIYKEGTEGPRTHLKLPETDGFSWYNLKNF